MDTMGTVLLYCPKMFGDTRGSCMQLPNLVMVEEYRRYYFPCVETPHAWMLSKAGF